MKKSLAFMLGLAMLATACQAAPAQTDELTTVELGVILPMSGDAAVYGEEIMNVFNYALPMVNEGARDKGYQFELALEDGTCAGSAASNALQKLHDIDGVEFVLGGGCSSESLAIAPLLVENGMVAMSALSSSPELKGASPNFHSLSYSDDSIGMGIAELLNGYERVGILVEQADWSGALTDVVRANLESELVLDLSVEEGATDFRNELQQLKAEDLDVIFFAPNIGAQGTVMARQISEIEGWDAQLVSHIGMLADDVLALDTEVLEGMIAVDSPRPEGTEFLEMVEAIKAEQGDVSNIGNYYVASALESMALMTELIMEHDGDVAAVADALNTETFDAMYLEGTINFDGDTYSQGMGSANFVIEDGAYALMQ